MNAQRDLPTRQKLQEGIDSKMQELLLARACTTLAAIFHSECPKLVLVAL